jgi:hypothetical protein
MTVVPFRRPLSRRTAARPVEPPAALSGSMRATRDSALDTIEDRRRMQQNWAALVAVVLLLALGAWLIDRLQAYSRTLACIEFGHRSCMKLPIGEPK